LKNEKKEVLPALRLQKAKYLPSLEGRIWEEKKIPTAPIP
jgi:hypothetical protein